MRGGEPLWVVYYCAVSESGLWLLHRVSGLESDNVDRVLRDCVPGSSANKLLCYRNIFSRILHFIISYVII